MPRAAPAEKPRVASCSTAARTRPRADARDTDGETPRSVCAIAVGWCPKSSITLMPRTSPRTSWRRAIPGKLASAACDLRLRHAVKLRRRDGHGGVAHVELADHRDLESLVAKLEAGARGRTPRRESVARNSPRSRPRRSAPDNSSPPRRNSASSPFTSTMPFYGTMFSIRRKLSLISSRLLKMSA